MMYKRILLALDGSDMSEQAIAVDLNQARCFQSELFLLRVINSLSKSYPLGKTTLSTFEYTEEQLFIIANDYLEKIANNLREDNITNKIATKIGVPYREIDCTPFSRIKGEII